MEKTFTENGPCNASDTTYLYKACEQDFLRIFGCSLREYWDFLLGFRLIKFDEQFLKTPKGISTKKFILEKYGQEAVDLLWKLIGK